MNSSDDASGRRSVTRVAGWPTSSSQSTTTCSPPSSPSGNGALTLNPTPRSSTATSASGICSRNIVRTGRGSNVTVSVIRYPDGAVGADRIPTLELEQPDDRQRGDDGPPGRDDEVVAGRHDVGHRLPDRRG